jgi:diacylglycerol diphosphate phosphatase/phosphatidate phosphatase
MSFLSWVLFAKLRVFDGSGHTWKLLAALSPLFVSIAVGITRYSDYWHHWSDIVTGLLLGLTVSALVYRQHYPAVWSADCDRELVPVASARTINGRLGKETSL